MALSPYGAKLFCPAGFIFEYLRRRTFFKFFALWFLNIVFSANHLLLCFLFEFFAGNTRDVSASTRDGFVFNETIGMLNFCNLGC